ncbi:MAG: LruC domain-containing protein [Bacteroidales bacterium]|nr:LruC domain-containing protein [Bacteroidales bacterium]
MKRFTSGMLLMIFVSGLLLVSCNKDNHKQNEPTNFLDLKIDQSFTFDNFSNFETSIKVPATRSTGVDIIQIYDGKPESGGKVILTGALDQNGEFSMPIRIPNRLTEVYVGKLSSSGQHEFVAVPVTGNKIQFQFSGVKSSETVPSCDPGCTQAVQGVNNNLTINSGTMICVDEGTTAIFNSLKINSGGILRVCGNATVNSYANGGGEGTLIVSPSGTVNLPKYNNEFTIEVYGSLNYTGNGTVQWNGSTHNWGAISSSIKVVNQGSFINDGTFTVSKDFVNNPDGTVVNNCQFYVTDESNNAFQQNSDFTNNGYVDVSGTAILSGSGPKLTTLGLGSLMRTKNFKIQGNVAGPNSQGGQIRATEDGQTSAGSNVTGFVDLCVSETFNPNNGNYGPDVTFCAYTQTTPQCSANVAPTITSSLNIGGIVNQPMTPYVITATGTEPISFNATNLPAGLVYNATTHTISGTPTSAGSFQVPLTATNFMGSDNQTLTIEVTQPAAPPVITSALTATGTVNQSLTYLMTASGTGPITYAATNLPSGLSFNPSTQQITGSPSAAGTYNITLSATNEGGTTTQVLVLTVGTPPTITSALTASGTANTQFTTYTILATGTPTITYTASNLPQGLSYNAQDHAINGTPTFAGVTNVTLTATNGHGTDIQTLVITINEGAQPPVITSTLTASAVKDNPFSYSITASGSQPMTFNATGLPAGLSFNGNIISGIPTVAGTYNITLTANNSAGTDIKTLVLTVAAGTGTDTDGDGIPDNLDQYPNDPTRAFNSYYPNEADYGSLAFEDLWPAYGDYDFNDFVVNINYKTVTNAQNQVVDIIAKYQIMADGASLDNGFGIVLNAPSSTVASVTGCIKLGNAVIYDPKGFEAGHTNSTVIIPFDAINPIMDGGMANTIPNGKYIQTSVNTVTVNFETPQANIGMPPYNPFIFVDQERGHEVHLKDQPHTEFADPAFFGTQSDASNPDAGLYYRSSTGLPWAVETPLNFDYPVEKVDILMTHLKFAAWAQSSGADYPDWYMSRAGYRNQGNIYVIPQ